MICYVPSVGCNSSSNVRSDSKLSTMGELSFSRITLPPFSGSPAFLSRVDTSFFGEGVAFLCVSSVPLLFCAEKNYMLNESKGIFDHRDQIVFPITTLFNYMWTLNFKSKLTKLIASFACVNLKKWTMKHRNSQNRSKSTNHKSQTMTFFPRRSAKMIDSSKECKH